MFEGRDVPREGETPETQLLEDLTRRIWVGVALSDGVIFLPRMSVGVRSEAMGQRYPGEGLPGCLRVCALR